MSLPYLHYDVFTSEPFTGNQLAVFPDGRGIDAGRMQALAREMNFSESTFILPPETPGTDVRMRIFTPWRELPMAGHPTIGSAFALADLGVVPIGSRRFVFGLGVGPTTVELEWEERRLRFAWMTQPTPSFGPVVEEPALVAHALGIQEDALAGRLPIQSVSCGVPYLMVPLRDAGVVDSAVSDAQALARLGASIGGELPVFLFALQPGPPDATVYSRMFAPLFGIAEDPATGSASGPLGCYLVRHRLVSAESAKRIVNVQGVAMGRASRIYVSIEGEKEEIASVKVGGEAVFVARGEVMV